MCDLGPNPSSAGRPSLPTQRYAVLYSNVNNSATEKATSESCNVKSGELVSNTNIFQDRWIWKNGLVVRTKNQIDVLTKKVEIFNSNIEKVGNGSGYLKDMLDLNTELTGYFSAITDNVNVQDLFDFLTICYCEYEHFFNENRDQILIKEEEKNVLFPLAYDIVFNEIKTILDFITNNTVNM